MVIFQKKQVLLMVVTKSTTSARDTITKNKQHLLFFAVMALPNFAIDNENINNIPAYPMLLNSTKPSYEKQYQYTQYQSGHLSRARHFFKSKI